MMCPQQRQITTDGGRTKMTLFKRNRKSTTRIVSKAIDKVMDTTPQQAIISSVLHTQRWDLRRETPFRGFDSPPGRF